jgi:hypothetical protein
MPVQELLLAGRGVRALTAASMTDFLDMIEKERKGDKDEFSADWAGATFDDALAQGRTGDLSQVARSDALLDKIEAITDGEGLKAVTSPSVAGGAVNVPAYLAGHPACMRLRRPQVQAGGEIVLMVSAFISASISHEVIARRGAAQLALVRALSQVRPVRLFVYGCHTPAGSRHGRHFFAAYPIDTAPMDLARAAWALCAPQSYRQVLLHADRIVGATETSAELSAAIPTAWAKMIEGEDTSVLVTPPLVSGDGSVPFESDEAAAAWVQAKVREALG